MKTSKLKVQDISLGLVDEPGGSIRLEINEEEIRELADNITQIGLLQPITVRPIGDRFEIVDGHRRYLSFKVLAREKIPCIVRDLDDVTVAVSRASANLRVVGLSLIEEAAIYADLRDNHKLTVNDIGALMGVSPGIVKRRLYLLKMPPSLQKAVHEKKISYSVAEEFWSLRDVGTIDFYLAQAVDHGCSLSVARDWVRDHRRAERFKASGAEGGGGVPAPFEPRPSYIACDLCKGPFELGKETLFRCCDRCAELIRKSLHASGE